MHYFWIAAWDQALSAQQHDMLMQATVAGFNEDKEMLEAIQTLMARVPRGLGYPEVMLNSDQAAVQARRQLQRHLDQDLPR